MLLAGVVGCAGRTGLAVGAPPSGTGTTTTPTAPWRAVIDHVPAGFVRKNARQRCCPSTDPVVLGTAPSQPDLHHSAFGPDDASLRPPWLWVSLAPTTGDPLAVRESMSMSRTTRTTINGHDALMDVRMADVLNVDVRVDDGHLLSAQAWGLSIDQLSAALDGAEAATDGRVDLPHLPAGMRELSTVDPTEERALPNFSASYLAGSSWLSISVVQGDRRLLASRLSIVPDPTAGADPGTIEPVQVQGQPGLARFSPSGDGRLHVTVVWHDAARDRVGQIGGEYLTRAEIDTALASVRDLDDAAWQDLLHRCPDARAPLELVGSC